MGNQRVVFILGLSTTTLFFVANFMHAAYNDFGGFFLTFMMTIVVGGITGDAYSDL